MSIQVYCCYPLFYYQGLLGFGYGLCREVGGLGSLEILK